MSDRENQIIEILLESISEVKSLCVRITRNKKDV